MANYRLSGTLRGTQRHEVWIVDGVISYRAPQGRVIDMRGYVYPGLLDAHTHPGLNRDGNLLSRQEVRRRLEALRSWGVTAVRDSGGQQNPSHDRAVGLPRIIHCGQHISRPRRYTRYLAVEVEPEDLVAQALFEYEKSDGWIKLVGDWIDREAGDNLPVWPRQALVEAVAAVHERGGKVTVHSFCAETIDDLLEAGVDGIEHGTGMTAEHLQEVARREILITPTVHQIRRFPEFAHAGARFPKYAQRMLRMDEHRREHLQLMIDSGVPMLMGTDTAENVTEVAMPHELIAAVEDGFSPALAMANASYAGRRRLGFPTWEEGMPADFVVYGNDPEVDIRQTLTPASVFIDGIRFPGKN
ncbi:amidohydrolase family protein [Arcanobacterium phocisimile]|uniref:Amidohydrolase family protein n=1 Tax=Arcanobacterium phocisimile TaxID=1302235 RepID=A0ABX7IJH1_9ACTO|nr:amidohydrolase family protein [Arcanobacterium phocisimile]QRV02679.1 amidohydrolase family protein [Arcanobacterium phocisimile]